jgi:GT2 family glycosyltransferase
MKPILAVIPSYGLADLTEKCLTSLREHSGELCEVAIVDNDSPSPDKAKLAELCERFAVEHVVWNETNLGFTPAVNIGIRKRKPGQHVLVLNTDAFPAPGCIERLLWHVNHDPKIGTIGPLSNCGSIHSLRFTEGRRRRFRSVIEALHDPTEAARRLVQHADRECTDAGDMTCFFCVIIPDQVIERVGILDETFADGLGADNDYCYRVKQAGFKNKFAADALCYHEGHQSFKRMKVPRNHQEAYRRLWKKYKVPQFARGRR